MKNADMPIHPMLLKAGGVAKSDGGLTKREHFAGLAMQAILSQQPPFDVTEEDMPEFMAIAARYSAMAADALLAELERTNA